jgi:hypothetical protein
MVEDDLTPARNGMADSTIGPKLPGMRFVLGMAGDTGRVSALISPVLVAVQTLQVRVTAFQQEPSCAVVEGGKFPAFRGMANCALGAHVSLMDIVFQVAVFTSLGGVLQHL